MGEKLIHVKRVAAALGATMLAGALTVTTTGSGPATAAARRVPPPATFTVSSFNVLGSSHTPAGGRRAVGTTRIVWANQLLNKHGVDVVGFQEMQADQYTKFMQVTSKPDAATGVPIPSWGVFPGLTMLRRDSENSIAWRLSRFDLVDATTFTIPYFDGNPRSMPLVLLREKATGMLVYVANVHNPADTARYRNQQKWRTIAKGVEAALQRRLTPTGIPRLFTGDMNERATFFCSMVSTASIKAARGGTYRNGVCDARRPRAVDWIMGSERAAFSGYTEDRSPLVAKTTDHPVIVSDVTLSRSLFPRALGTPETSFPTFASYTR